MRRRVIRFFVAALLSIACATAAEHTFVAPVDAGELGAPPKLETSGLAASHRNAEVLWTHDDSGGAAALYAVKTTGQLVGVLHVKGAKNEDWEDLASYELGGKPWLLIADTGDNDAKRSHVLLHILEEPAIDRAEGANEWSARPARTLRVRYEDGARDCEAVAVDAKQRAIYLLTKRDEVKRLYCVALEPKDTDAIAIARFVTAIARLPQPTAEQRGIKGYLGRRRAEVTAMDFNADGSAAIVLTYGDLLLFARRANESWSESFSRAPRPLPSHGLIQAEAACFSVDGRHIFVAAENWRTLLRYDVKP
jgi:hypothetical protein